MKKVILSLFSASAICILLSYYAFQQNPGRCPQDQQACYFSNNYYQARALFREKSRNLKQVETYSHKIQSQNPSDDLSIDVAVINKQEHGKTQDQRVLIHFSGLHGVEGYAGSAIQSAFLDKLHKQEIEIPDNITIVIFHALNPFGFLYNRRWNENNVDLNRNVLPEETFPGELKTLNKIGVLGSYKDYQSYFNLDHTWITPLDDIIFFFKTMYYLLIKGFNSIKAAAVSGQYFSEDQIWYGGHELQPSNKFVIEFLRNNFSNYKQAMMIDIHTGLGPESIDTLICTQKGEQLIRKIINDDGTKNSDYIVDCGHNDQNQDEQNIQQDNNSQTDIMEGFQKARGLSINFLKSANFEQGLSVVQEFGTVSGLKILKYMIEENSYWNQGSKQQKAYGGHLMKSVFHLEKASYKKNIIKRGLILLQQSINGLSTTDTKSIPYL